MLENPMKNQISALMDDELSLEEASYLLTAMKQEGTASNAWSTYHLIGDAMRGEAMLNRNIKQQIMQQLQDAPVVLAPKASATLKPVKTSVTWSVAASVAAVMFVGWVTLQQQTQLGNSITSMQMAQNAQVSPASKVNLATKTNVINPVNQAKQTIEIPSEYLLAHQSMASNSAAYYIQPAAYNDQSR